jgi:competence protein ComGF
MDVTQLVENFKSQQSQVMEEIKKLEVELLQKKELYVKLQGAIEGFDLLTQTTKPTEQLQEEELQP